ncbi:MAG: DUF3795 domain-containing protein [Candidatus Bathyarchaeota archaeon]
MSSDNYGVCGVYCGQCPSGNGRVRYAAGELKRLIDTTRYEWLNEVEKRFSFDEFRKGLEWFAQAQCPGCLSGGGAPCANRGCAKEKGLRSCLECGEYLACKNTEYHREWYPFVLDSYERVKEIGLDAHLEEEERRARAGVSNMSHLERRCCKEVELG